MEKAAELFATAIEIDGARPGYHLGVDGAVGTQVSFLTEKDVDDQLTLAGRLPPAGRRRSR